VVTPTNGHSHSQIADIPTPVSAVRQGVVYPLEFLTIIRDATSLSEFKVIAAVWGYDAVVGVDAEALTFTDIQERTGLTNKSVSEGIKRAIDNGSISPKEVNGTRFFLPKGVEKSILEKSIPHDHDHEYVLDDLSFTRGQDSNHDHAGESKLRQDVYQILLNEFGMVVSEKVAHNLALTPKYPVSKLWAQIRHTRWEVKHGEDGNADRPISNPAGRLVHRLKMNKPAPRGFNLNTVLLEDEGWSQERLWDAIFNGEVDLPTIKNSYPYQAWIASSTGREAWLSYREAV
jgi:hypothetical protein